MTVGQPGTRELNVHKGTTALLIISRRGAIITAALRHQGIITADKENKENKEIQTGEDKMKYIKFILLSGLFLLLPGCYTVIWDPDVNSPSEVRQDDYTAYYEPEYYGDYYYYYDTPWWATTYNSGSYYYDNNKSDGKSTNEKTRGRGSNSNISSLRENDGGRVNPLRDLYHFNDPSSSTTIRNNGSSTGQNNTTQNTGNTTSKTRTETREQSSSNNNSTTTNNNNKSSENKSSIRDNDGGRNNGDRRR